MSPDVEAGMLKNQNALAQIATSQQQKSEDLFRLTEPGMAQAEDFYSKLASGDPAAIMRAIGPAAGQIEQAATGATKNVMETAPAGGEKNLALANIQAGRGAEVGKVASEAYLKAPAALASLAGQGVGESISAAGTGVSGLSAASSGLASLGGLQIEQAQFQAQQKGSMLGGLGTIAQTVGSVASSQIGGLSWTDALAALA